MCCIGRGRNDEIPQAAAQAAEASSPAPAVAQGGTAGQRIPGIEDAKVTDPRLQTHEAFGARTLSLSRRENTGRADRRSAWRSGFGAATALYGLIAIIVFAFII